MRWRTSAQVLTWTGASIALILVGACSAPPPRPVQPSAVSGSAVSGTATSGPDATAGPAQPPAGSGGVSGGGQPAGSNESFPGGFLAWVPPGPVDPADPPQSQWYKMLQDKDCAGLQADLENGNASTPDGLALWGAAAASCRAVYQGDASGWSDAATGLSTVGQPDAGRCLDRAAYDLMAALLAFHAQNPDAVPSPVAGAGTACPLELTGLVAPDGTGTAEAPSSGLAGGEFQLQGRFLDVTAVLVGAASVGVAPDPNQSGRWVVVIPPATAPGPVQVTATGSAGPIPGSLTFTYVDDAAAPAPDAPAPADEPAPPAPADAPAPSGDGAGTTPEVPSSSPSTSAGGD